MSDLEPERRIAETTQSSVHAIWAVAVVAVMVCLFILLDVVDKRAHEARVKIFEACMTRDSCKMSY